MTAPTAGHCGLGDNYATGVAKVKKNKGRTLRPTGKLEELTHKMDGYRWIILGLCLMGWKNLGEISSVEKHKVYFSGEEDTRVWDWFSLYIKT